MPRERQASEGQGSQLRDEHGNLRTSYVVEGEGSSTTEETVPMDGIDRSHTLLKLRENKTKLGLYYTEELMPVPVIEFFDQVQREHGVVIVAKLDIDDLKRFNDAFGHLLADEFMTHLFSQKVQLLTELEFFQFFIWQPHAGGDEANLVLGFFPTQEHGMLGEESSARLLEGVSALLLGKDPRKRARVVRDLAKIVEKALATPFADPDQTGGAEMRLGFGVVAHDLGGKKQGLSTDELKQIGEELFAKAEEVLEEQKQEKVQQLEIALEDLAAGASVSAEQFMARATEILSGGRFDEVLFQYALTLYGEVLLREGV